MIKDKKVIGIILARGGSKGVPRKNIRALNGIPLVAYTICEALRSQYLDRVIVSTDDPEIQKVALEYGADAPFLRPEKLAEDTATAHDACEHAVEYAEKESGESYDYVVEMLTTNPMKTSEDIDGCIEKIYSTDADSVIGVTKLEDHHPIRIKKIEDDRIVDFCFPEVHGSRRQDLKPDAYIRNGSVYACKRSCIQTRVGCDNSRPFVMPEERLANIDTMNDFLLAEVLVKKYPRNYIQPAQKERQSSQAPSYIPSTDRQKRVLITTVPFGDYDNSPIDLLKANDVEFVINPLNRKPTEDETIEMIKDFGIVLAGTSPFTAKVMDAASDLKLIARAGIGIDNVDLKEAAARGIQVTYTPTAPSPAVAEMTVGLILSVLRKIPQTNASMHAGEWNRQVGTRLGECTVGLYGMGAIGKHVVKYMSGFSPKVLAFDLKPDMLFGEEYGIQWVSQEELFQQSDVISVHVPLTDQTRQSIGEKEFAWMKNSSVIVNTARGGIVDEEALAKALSSGKIAGAAMDVFETEPYIGPLTNLKNCILTAHMGAASSDCKRAMETGAAEEIIRFIKGEPLLIPVPRLSYC